MDRVDTVYFTFSLAQTENITSEQWKDTVYVAEYMKGRDIQWKKYTDILDKYGIKHSMCDTIPGSFNLNRNWIQTESFPAVIEWNYVRPVGWLDSDFDIFYRAEHFGKIIVLVHVLDSDGNWQLNV